MSATSKYEFIWEYQPSLEKEIDNIIEEFIYISRLNATFIRKLLKNAEEVLGWEALKILSRTCSGFPSSDRSEMRAGLSLAFKSIVGIKDVNEAEKSTSIGDIVSGKIYRVFSCNNLAVASDVLAVAYTSRGSTELILFDDKGNLRDDSRTRYWLRIRLTDLLDRLWSAYGTRMTETFTVVDKGFIVDAPSQAIPEKIMRFISSVNSAGDVLTEGILPAPYVEKNDVTRPWDISYFDNKAFNNLIRCKDFISRSKSHATDKENSEPKVALAKTVLSGLSFLQTLLYQSPNKSSYAAVARQDSLNRLDMLRNSKNVLMLSKKAESLVHIKEYNKSVEIYVEREILHYQLRAKVAHPLQRIEDKYIDIPMMKNRGKYPILFDGSYIITKKLWNKIHKDIAGFITSITEHIHPTQESLEAIKSLNQYSKYSSKKRLDEEKLMKRLEEEKRASVANYHDYSITTATYYGTSTSSTWG